MAIKWACETCKNSTLMKIAVAVPTQIGGHNGQPGVAMAKVLRPVCSAFTGPVFLDPSSPVVECERYSGDSEGLFVRQAESLVSEVKN